MRLVIHGILVVGITAGSIQCVHKEREASSGAELSNWHNKMHVLSNSLSRLLPLTASPRAFNDPKNREAIELEIRNLKAIAHSVDSTKAKPGHDPGMAFMAQRFAENMDLAVHQMDNDNLPYARRLIQQSTAHCISCHTRTDQGRSDLQLSSLANIDGLRGLEQADFFIAVRDYDKALNKFGQVVNSPDAQIQHPHDMEVSAEKALAIAVRVKRDPNLADELVNRIIDARWAPVYLRLNALTWKRSIEDWRRNQSQKKLTSKEQFQLAKQIMNQGWKVNSRSPLGQAGLVQFLRASSILHELLGQSPEQGQYGEMLYYSGLAAESLRDMNLWTLQDAYYESCIRHSPKTQIAKKCYLRLEAIQFSAYVTDDGAYLPREVRDRLIELKNLSQDTQEKLYDWELMGE